MWLFLLNKEHFLAAYIFHILVTEWKVPCSKDQYKVWYFDFIYLQKNWRSRAHDKSSGSEFGLQQHWTSSTLDGKEAQIPSYYKFTEKQDILSRYNFVNRVFKTANQQKSPQNWLFTHKWKKLKIFWKMSQCFCQYTESQSIPKLFGYKLSSK